MTDLQMSKDIEKSVQPLQKGVAKKFNIQGVVASPKRGHTPGMSGVLPSATTQQIGLFATKSIIPIKITACKKKTEFSCKIGEKRQ